MRPTDNIRNSFRKLKIPTSSELDKKIHEEISRASGQANKNIPAQPVLWRIIMRSKITKFATSIVIIGLVVFGITLIDKTSTPAYAFEQTLEAFKNVKTIHLWGKDLSNKDLEMWVKLDPNTGMPDYCRLYIPDYTYLAVSRPEKSYTYIKNLNQVQIKPGRMFSIEVAPANIFEELVKHLKADDPDYKVNIEYKDGPEIDKTIIVAIYESPIEKWRFEIDTETKLLISARLLSETHRKGLVFRVVNKIAYNIDLPEELFEFEIPEGAQVIEQ